MELLDLVDGNSSYNGVMNMTYNLGEGAILNVICFTTIQKAKYMFCIFYHKTPILLKPKKSVMLWL